MGKLHLCKPRVFTTEGADHTGVDAYLKCIRCARRTMNHVECSRVTPEVETILRREWRAGRAALNAQGEETLMTPDLIDELNRS